MFTDDVIVYVENLKESIINLELVNVCSILG